MKFSYSLSLRLGHRDAQYIAGFRYNVNKIRSTWPSASITLHHDSSVGADLLCLADATVEWERRNDLSCAFWRFASIDNLDTVLVRDCDSPIIDREIAAVNHWLACDKLLHTMHDHPAHAAKTVLAGLWGAKPGGLPLNFAYLVRWWLTHRAPFTYGTDEWFLHRYVYPYVIRNGLSHRSVRTDFQFSVAFPFGAFSENHYVGMQNLI